MCNLLRNLRRTKTLKDVAQATGLSITYISDLEHQRRKGSIDTLRKLADFYNCDYEALCKAQLGKERM